MKKFAIGSFSNDAGSFVGLVQDHRVWDVSAFAGLHHVHDALTLLQDWERNESLLLDGQDKAPAEASCPLDALRIEAPIVPRQIFCIGANYRKHVVELALKQADPASAHLSSEERAEAVAKMMDERARTGTPYAFVKLPTAVTAPYGKIILPRGSQQTDWELELGVVIGRPARHVSRADALSFVAGYTIANDVTARDRVYRPDLKAIGTDWLSSKNAATFLPLGPWIVPARFVGDPQDLRITLKLNGAIMQDDFTSDMLFDIARQIEYLSSIVELLPGDIICTGSPPGNGTHYQRFLRPGDVVEGTIANLGTQRLTCVDED